MRIAIGGIGHETNTFSTLPTRYRDFQRVEGAELVSGPEWDDIRRDGVDVIPLFSAHAAPSGQVTRSAFEKLLSELITRLTQCGLLDGVLLILHGAMEVAEIGDGESAILKAVRTALGERVFVTVTLDLHANLAPYVAANSQIITAYRTAPHRDVAQTILRGMRLTVECIKGRRRPVACMTKLPLLVAGEAAVTEVEPADSLFALLADIDTKPGILVSSILIGCAWTDSEHTAVSAVVCGIDREAAQREANRLASAIWDHRYEFAIDSETASVEESIDRALASTAKPVFISDSGDNTTAGAAGDTPVFLAHLVDRAAPEVLVAGITDPDAVRDCKRSGEGTEVHVSIGGKLDAINAQPYGCRAAVLSVKSSEKLGGNPGDRVLVRVGTVDVVLQTDRRPFTSLNHFSEIGIRPEDYAIIVVKEGYLFPELRDFADHHIMALSPGFGDQRLERLRYSTLKRPIVPLDSDVPWDDPSPGLRQHSSLHHKSENTGSRL